MVKSDPAGEEQNLTPQSLPEQPSRPAHLFKPGQSGNPAGRPVGSRNKVSTVFFDDLYALWQRANNGEEHKPLTLGQQVLAVAMAVEPMKFVGMVASLQPRDVNINAVPMQQFTDDELLDGIRNIKAYLNGRADGSRVPTTIEGTSVVDVQAVPEAG